MRNRFYAYWFSYLPMLDADAGSGGSGDAGQGDSSNSGDAGDGDGTQRDDNGKQAPSQADIDKIVTQRLARAKKQWEADAKAAADKAAMTEAERLKAEKDELEKALQTERETIKRERMMARAESLAVKAGGRPDRAEDIAAKADLSDIEIDANGKLDNDAISKAIEAVLKKYPEWKGGSDAASRSGGQFSGNAGSAVADMNANIRRAAGKP